MATIDKAAQGGIKSWIMDNAKRVMEGASLDSESQVAVIQVIEEITRAFTTTNATQPAMAQSIVQNSIEYAKSQNKFPVTIIDEANEVLVSADTDQEVSEETKALLIQMIAWTNRTERLTLFCLRPSILIHFVWKKPSTLATSATLSWQRSFRLPIAGRRWYMLRTHLEIQRFGPGKISWEWARILQNYSSQHMAAISSRCILLWTDSRMQRNFSMKQGFPGLVELQAGTGIEVKGAKPYLSLMAKDGFAPLKKKDMNVAKQLSSIGLCGVVADSSKSSGVPRFLWEKGETSLGLIPSSQLTRLAIGKAIAAETFGWGRLLPWRWFKGEIAVHCISY